MVTIGSHRSADRAARMVLEEHRRKAFETAFKNTKLAKKNESIKEDALSLYDETKSFMEAVADAAGGSVPSLPSKDALSAILRIAGIAAEEKSDFEAVFSEELALMVVNGLTGVASLMVPYMGLVMGGKDMLAEWVKTAIAGHKSYTTKRTIPTDILPGDPQLAAQAVRKIITREASNHARLATINTVKFAVDVSVTAGAMGADVASPITGAATAGAKLANSIFLLGRDYYEMKSANALLTSGTLPDPTKLFNSHPILGAYLIVGADDSDLLFFLIDDMGAPGWMDKVEQQKKKTLGPLQKEARKAIENSRFDLAGFSGVKFKKPGVASKQSRVAQIKGFVSKLF